MLFVPKLNESKIKFFAVLLIILVGITVRFWGLADNWAHPDDFGVAKSILDYRQLGKFGWFAVPNAWTYAPAQFLITPLLISSEQSYRDLLFWGRLPSVIFACFGLIAFVALWRKYDIRQWGAGLLALTIFTCSWENIIFARQMNNYALGVTASVLLLWLLLGRLRSFNFSIGRVLTVNVCLAVFFYLQYSLLFLFPAFWLTYFIFGWRYAPKKISWTLKYGAGIALFGVLVYPLYHFFLSKLQHHGIYDWNKGPTLEFFYQWDKSATLIANVIYTIKFYIVNFWLTFRSMVSMVPEASGWCNIMAAALLGLFALGCFSLCRTKETHKKYFGIFVLTVAVSWAILIALQKLTFSPTRHYLNLLVVAAMVVAEGVIFLACHCEERQRRSNPDVEMASVVSLPRHDTIQLVLAGIILIFFLAYIPQFIRERRDPFNETELVEVLKRYQVDALLTTFSTQHPEIMPQVRQYFNYNGKEYIFGAKVWGVMTSGVAPYRRIAFLSFRDKMTPEFFEEARRGVNEYIYMSNGLRARRQLPPLMFIRYPYQAYHLIYSKEVESDVQIEFSRHTHHGHNGLYLYVFER